MQSKSKYKRYTVTAALPYANGPIHIGHMAGVYIPADIYVRYLRMKNEDVIFVCGSDEHGVPITIRAGKENKTPQEVVDKYHFQIKKSFSDFGISFDIYHRTSSSLHHETASGFFKNLYDKGIFIEKSSEQYFDLKTGQFLADRYIVGTCPRCGFQNAYGDQCESCGSTLSPSDLINPKSMLSGEKPVLKDTKHWYLPLDNFEPWLKQWILSDHKEWKSNVYGQCKSWLDNGLNPRAVTRDLDWGIPVPVPGTSGKVLYVWFDAPIGYISATRQWAEDHNKDWELYWKSKDTRLIHFIGKDNIVFHCLIFPSMLQAHGDYILPDNVPANEFLNLENDKISTSRNWAVWLYEYMEDFPGKQDVLRYVLTSNMPETKDNDFTWKDFQAKNNNELLAILGNFVNRAMVLTHKLFEGKVPPRGIQGSYENELMDKISKIPGNISGALENFKFRESLTSYIEIARLGNKYLADTEPWKLIKQDSGRVGTILNTALQIVARLGIYGEPFLPATSLKIRQMTGISDFNWQTGEQPIIIREGFQLGQPLLLFEKIEDEDVDRQVQKLKATKETNKLSESPSFPPIKPEISYEDFAKLDMRIGQIVEAKAVKDSKKLLQLVIDIGTEKRNVLSGIAEQYLPEEIIGKKVVLLANLMPRKIVGLDSQGMILMAEDSKGHFGFLRADETNDNGSMVS